MIVTIAKCLRQTDAFGRILAQSFRYTVSHDDGSFGQDSSYVLRPDEFADDISPIIKRETEAAVKAFIILDTPPATVDEAKQYGSPVVDAKDGSVTVTRDASIVATPALTLKV